MYGQFFVLFAIIFTGYFLRKINFINEEMNGGLNKFIVYFAYPCLLIKNIAGLHFAKGLLKDFAIMLLVTLLMFGVYALFAYGYGKLRDFPKRAANTAEVAMVAPNDGFMGFPVALIFLGEKGLFLMMAHNVVLNIYFFTLGLKTLRRNNEVKEKLTFSSILKSMIKVILNPNILAIIIGFFILSFDIQVYSGISAYFEVIGNVATPMAMIFIGSTLAGSGFFEMLKNHIVWESALIKLVLLPVITAILVAALPISIEIKATVILGCCFPTGATVAMLAEQENQNKELATKILFFTTIVSMATIPISIWAIEKFFI